MLTKNIYYSELKSHSDLLSTKSIKSLFSDKLRFKKFSKRLANHDNGVNLDILFDYSKQKIDKKAIELLLSLAESSDLNNKITAKFQGEKINTSENRSVLHTALRDSSKESLLVDDLNIKDLINSTFDQMTKFSEAVRNGDFVGISGNKITDVISLGIGGSDLGPLMAYEALLGNDINNHINVHFISNVDSSSLKSCLAKLKPETTLCLVNSKTFTTPETLVNAKSVRGWLGDNSTKQMIAVTANPNKAIEFGILNENVFEFWDFIGGRYSIWSAVGLSIAIAYGIDTFKELLEGASVVDEHFKSKPLAENIPVLMGLIGIWNTNFLGAKSLAIIPYSDKLAKFPDYLQQLEMESNGKRVSIDGEELDYPTCPVIWGGVGCNGQHAYMQLLHQGLDLIPVDFILPVTGDNNYKEQLELLISSCLGQSKALMEGTSGLDSQKTCKGDRPSSTLLFSHICPQTLGSLIAIYEHKVFVQGVIWGINSFDQWGVELGKKLIKEIIPQLNNENIDSDCSTIGLIEYIKEIGE